RSEDPEHMRATRCAVVLAAMVGTLLLPAEALWAGASSPEHRATASGAALGSRLLLGGGSTIDDVSCASAMVCTAVGGSWEYPAAIFRTTDGGKTWSLQSPPQMPRL